MSRNYQKYIQISLKDLFYVVLRKIWIIVLIGCLSSGILFAYSLFSSTNDANVLDVSVRLDNENDVSYADRVRNVNRAKDVLISINALTKQIDSQRDYLSKSIIMQIDYTNEAVTSAQVVVCIKNNQVSDADKALFAAYSQELMSGGYLNELAQELGTDQIYLKELISFTRENTNSVSVNYDPDLYSTDAYTIVVKGPNTDFTDSVMERILEEVSVVSKDLNNSIASHSVLVAGKQSYYTFDSATRDLQHLSANRSDALQKQIDAYDASLNDIASHLGLSNKSNFYSYFSYNDDSWIYTRPSIISTSKSSLKGFIVGAFLVVFIISANYIFGNRFSTQGKFFGRFPNIRKIGVVKPMKKRSRFAQYIDRRTYDDSELSYEDSYALIAANIKNLTVGMNSIMVTGTVDPTKIKELVDKLKIKADVKESFFKNPSNLASVSDYDCIIIVEQRNYSDCRLVSEEINLISNVDSKLIGALII